MHSSMKGAIYYHGAKWAVGAPIKSRSEKKKITSLISERRNKLLNSIQIEIYSDERIQREHI